MLRLPFTAGEPYGAVALRMAGPLRKTGGTEDFDDGSIAALLRGGRGSEGFRRVLSRSRESWKFMAQAAWCQSSGER